MKNKSIIGVFLLTASPCYSAIVVQGNETAVPYAFTTAITTKAYDPRTGSFFVGLTASDPAANNAYAISKAPRPTFTSVPKFSPVLSNTLSFLSSLLMSTIEFLAFSGQAEANRDVLIAVPLATAAFETTKVTALFTNGSAEITSQALNDAAGSATTEGIVQMTASRSSIFAAVRPNGSTFGDTNSGIALIGLGTATTIISGVSNPSIELNIKNATTGLNGNQAALLDKASEVLKGTSGGADVVFSTTQVAMQWDDPMQRLFIGIALESNAAPTDIAKAIVVGRLDSGVLNFQAIAPDSAISGGGVDEIVVAQDSSVSFSPSIVKIMHASTGPDYLIVDCAQNNVCNRVFALPLVNDTSNPSSSLNGTIAKKDSALNGFHKFVVPATTAGDLPENNATTNPQAVVGAGDLPIQPTSQISDMVVIGDGVYVAINDAPSSTNDTGIWYSQALFDSEGKILRWTTWSKRIVPINAFQGITLPGGSAHNGAVHFLEVDAKEGNVWLVEGTTDKTVGITSWNTGQEANDLLTRAGALLATGSYAVLDLHQTTRGFLDTTADRYALFGGTNKVVFARISVAADNAIVSSPQTSITDYSQAENLLSTLLPSKAGCCQVLEFSRTSTTADANPALTNYCFFFAGTENGLYVFSPSDGSGFNPITLSTLNVAPFSTRAWYKMERIFGSVIDIKTSGAGHTLYVIASESSKTEPMISTLYSIPFTDNTNTMFAQSNIHTIARTRTGVFANVVQFYGVQIVATGDPTSANPENKEQLVLATNQGLFHSNASQAGSASVATVTNQTDAQWHVVGSGNDSTAKTAFFGINQADTPIRQTTWPFSIQDQFGYRTFDRGSISQFSGNGDSAGTAAEFNTTLLPLKFNANPQTSAFSTLYPITYFHTDGGRRFLVYNLPTDPAGVGRIGLAPYDVATWNVTQPYAITNPTLNQNSRFYWLKQIGASGILMAGTGSGLVGLN